MAAKKTAALKSPKSSSRKYARKASAAQQAAGTEQAGDALVTIDRRRGSRRGEEAVTSATPAPVLERRKKVQRRRQIDPTTCERDYSVDEVEFMNAMDDYKRKSGRMFPTCSEVLEVIHSLGYVKLSPAGKAMLEANDEQVAAEEGALEEALASEVAY
jgi:hypothetical protein